MWRRAGLTGLRALRCAQQGARQSLSTPSLGDASVCTFGGVTRSSGFDQAATVGARAWVTHGRAMSKASEAPLDQEHAHIGNEIDKELLKNAEDKELEGLFRIVEEHGEFFNESNVITAFQQLGILANNLSEDDAVDRVHTNKSFQTLVDMVILGMRRFNNRQLLDVLSTCAQLKFDDDMLLDKLSTRILQRIEGLPGQELHDLVIGLAKADYNPGVVLFDALQTRASQVQGDLSPEAREDIRKAYESLGHSNLAKELPKAEAK